MGRRILNDALRTIVNAEKRGFASAELKPVSNVIASFLQIMKYRGMSVYTNFINNFLLKWNILGSISVVYLHVHIRVWV